MGVFLVHQTVLAFFIFPGANICKYTTIETTYPSAQLIIVQCFIFHHIDWKCCFGVFLCDRVELKKTCKYTGSNFVQQRSSRNI